MGNSRGEQEQAAKDRQNFQRRNRMKWISVKDELPKLNKKILAWNGQSLFVAFRWQQSNEEKTIHFDSFPQDEYGDVRFEPITHWMELPKAPEEK